MRTFVDRSGVNLDATKPETLQVGMKYLGRPVITTGDRSWTVFSPARASTVPNATFTPSTGRNTEVTPHHPTYVHGGSQPDRDSSLPTELSHAQHDVRRRIAAHPSEAAAVIDIVGALHDLVGRIGGAAVRQVEGSNR
jgi:hypothetical protein